jgi:D-arabinose 1-dehydrogenase-like Zn-dependent alcohol dehydrogenase
LAERATAANHCRRGHLIDCHNLRIPGINYDGGYAEAMVCPADALAAIPDDLNAAEAAPLLCAGITTFNALRHSGALPGDLVAVLGIGGLGHLGIQFAAKMGFRTVAIGRGGDKERLALKLGAERYIDSGAEDPVAALQALGGAKTILATVPSGKAVSPLVGGLGVRGKLVVIGISPEPIEVSSFAVVGQSASIVGHASGTSIESEDTLRFSAASGVRPMIETMPLEQAPEAYAKMMRGEARFRMVLTMDAG